MHDPSKGELAPQLLAESIPLNGKRPIHSGWTTRNYDTAEIATRIKQDGDVGVRNELFPALDIDLADPTLAAEVCKLALAELGEPLIRRSRPGSPSEAWLWPRAEQTQPFTRRVLKIGEGAVEIRGTGNQTMVWGTHPTGAQLAQEFSSAATAITEADVDRFLTKLAHALEAQGHTVRLLGGNPSVIPPQGGLLAPSDGALREVVGRIANDDRFATRHEWLKVAAAIRASTSDEELAKELFADFSERGAEQGGGYNDPDYVARTFDSILPPYKVGYSWLAERANLTPTESAQLDFEADPTVEPPASGHRQARKLEGVIRLGDLRDDPALLEEICRVPEPISPILAYRDRLTVISGREKLAGKSTLAGWDAAALSRSVPVVWATWDENEGDTVRRAISFDAGDDFYVVSHPPGGLEAVEQIAKEVGAAAIYIDSLTAWAAATGDIPKSSETEKWQAKTLQLAHLARRNEVAVVVIAHTAKSDSDGGIAGSVGKAAAADLIVRIKTPTKPNQTFRQLTFLGRWSVDSMRVELRDGGFVTDQDAGFEALDLALGPQIYGVLSREHEPPSKRKLRDLVQGGQMAIDIALAELIAMRAVENHGSDRHHRYVAVEGWTHSHDGQRLVSQADPLADLTSEYVDE